MVENYKNKDEYEKEVFRRCVLPKGFRVSVAPLKFFPKEKKIEKPLPMKLSAILLDEKTDSFGAVFTKNRFPGHPVVHGKSLLENEFCSGVLINNKISNVRCPNGLESINEILDEFSKEFNVNKNHMFVSSTGIIGWELPVNDIINTLPDLKNNFQDTNMFSVSKGIMTTDNFPKARTVKIKQGRITAIAKGAGMIEPNMATMLVFILTDISIEKEDISSLLKSVINKTFNRISIDSDQSTSDTAMIFSSKKVHGINLSEFENGLLSICSDLCQDVVRNGEGTSHVIEVTIKGVKNENDGLRIGKAIINAPLLKAAIYGNDPNLGRLLQAIGDVAGNEDIEIDPENLTLIMGDDIIYSNGTFKLNEVLEIKLNNYLTERALSEKAIGYPEHRNNVQIVVDLHNGNQAVTVYGSDLSYEYVRENADYRS